MELMNLLSTPEDGIAKSLLSNLLDQNRLYHQSKDYKALLNFITRLRNFATFNAYFITKGTICRTIPKSLSFSGK